MNPYASPIEAEVIEKPARRQPVAWYLLGVTLSIAVTQLLLAYARRELMWVLLYTSYFDPASRSIGWFSYALCALSFFICFYSFWDSYRCSTTNVSASSPASTKVGGAG